MWVDIENSAGVRLGPGPLRAVQHWQQTRRLDQAGTFSTTVAASDPRVALATAKRVLRCRATLNGAVVEVGAGVLDKRALGGATGPGLTLELSGNDLLNELADRSVGFLKLNDGSGGPATDALAQIMAFAPSGWGLDTTLGYGSTGAPVYVEFAGESVLAALGKVAELTGEHFRLGAGRVVCWLRTDRPVLPYRAVAAGEGSALDANPLLVLIKDLALDYDSHDVVTRVYPWGAGNANARVSMAATTRTAPAGYTLDLVNNYLESNVATAAYGRIERHVSIKELNKQGNSSPDAVSAANALFDAALLYLEAHGAEQAAYKVDLVRLPGVILPGHLIRVVYRRTVDGYTAINLNGDLLILESATEVDKDGIWTTGLTVANSDRWPVDDNTLLAGAIGQVRAMDAHPQPAESAGVVSDPHVAYRNQANSYTVKQTFATGVVNLAVLAANPASPAAGDTWLVAAGTSPARTLSLRVYEGGAVRTLASTTY